MSRYGYGYWSACPWPLVLVLCQVAHLHRDSVRELGQVSHRTISPSSDLLYLLWKRNALASLEYHVDIRSREHVARRVPPSKLGENRPLTTVRCTQESLMMPPTMLDSTALLTPKPGHSSNLVHSASVVTWNTRAAPSAIPCLSLVGSSTTSRWT